MADNIVVLYDDGYAKLELVRLLKEILGIPIKEAKDIVDGLANGPRSIELYGADAKKLTDGLKTLGVSFEHKKKNESSADASAITIGSKLFEDLIKRIEALEKRIDTLESNSNVSNKSVASDREVIIAHKKVTSGGVNNDYYKTNKNRILLDSAPRYHMSDGNYKKALINALISIGDNMEPKPNEEIETFLARIRAKYNPDPSLPTLLGGFVLMQSGALWSVSPTNRTIKF